MESHRSLQKKPSSTFCITKNLCNFFICQSKSTKANTESKQDNEVEIQEEKSHAITSISYNQLKFSHQLGMGTYAIVTKAKWQGKDIAVKQLHPASHFLQFKEACTFEKAIGFFSNEILAMEKMQQTPSKHVVSYLGTNSNPWMMYLEYCPNGDVCNYLRMQTSISWATRYKFMLGLAKGILAIHNIHLIHLDIKIENLLLDQHYNVKIGDFGFAESVDSENTNVNGTPACIAPEILKGSKRCFANDIYSMGVTFFEIATSQDFAPRPSHLSHTEHNQAIYKRAVQGIRPKIPSTVPSAIAKVIELCWQGDPVKRPSAEAMVELLKDAKGRDARLSP